MIFSAEIRTSVSLLSLIAAEFRIADGKVYRYPRNTVYFLKIYAVFSVTPSLLLSMITVVICAFGLL